MRINSENRDSIDKIHLYSGENKHVIRAFFESLITVILLDYMEGESTNIPFLGDIAITYKGEMVAEGRKEAKINIEVTPDANLLKNIGQLKDSSESDIEKMIKMRIREALRSYI